ncbi:Elastase [Aquicella siphonis]|uniref:Elastase n=1 Tax=Aquicella siphonis TaxID=254247 RepID=A0A5E4PET3_9COXI|nr:M4 family metallopeptidase [Aquicella siphonis]VVC74846.1 Elastase [Aquicella siphonis]
MHKVITLGLSFTFLTSAWAAQSQPSLFPIKSQAELTSRHSKFKENITTIAYLVKAGGYGGNEQIGKLIYAGISPNLPELTVSRDAATGICYMMNENANVTDRDYKTLNFSCISTDPSHFNLYWNDNFGAMNGGYSPANDMLYAVDTVTNMFKDWYNIPPVVDGTLKKRINVSILKNWNNATADVKDGIWVGDGIGSEIGYPLTSLGVISFLTGMIFTEQNSNLYDGEYAQSSGIAHAFYSMTAMAAEYYATGKNTWQVGADISRNGVALHYLDRPSKNGKDIDTLSQYHEGMQAFESCGLFNRAFYLLATSNGWDTHKAYNVFVQANRFHWRDRRMDFQKGACEVVISARELGYETASVMNAFSYVGIDDVRLC